MTNEFCPHGCGSVKLYNQRDFDCGSNGGGRSNHCKYLECIRRIEQLERAEADRQANIEKLVREVTAGGDTGSLARPFPVESAHAAPLAAPHLGFIPIGQPRFGTHEDPGVVWLGWFAWEGDDYDLWGRVTDGIMVEADYTTAEFGVDYLTWHGNEECREEEWSKEIWRRADAAGLTEASKVHRSGPSPERPWWFADNTPDPKSFYCYRGQEGEYYLSSGKRSGDTELSFRDSCRVKVRIPGKPDIVTLYEQEHAPYPKVYASANGTVFSILEKSCGHWRHCDISGNVWDDSALTEKAAAKSGWRFLSPPYPKTVQRYLDSLKEEAKPAEPEWPKWCIGLRRFQSDTAIAEHCIADGQWESVPAGDVWAEYEPCNGWRAITSDEAQAIIDAAKQKAEPEKVEPLNDPGYQVAAEWRDKCKAATATATIADLQKQLADLQPKVRAWDIIAEIIHKEHRHDRHANKQAS